MNSANETAASTGIESGRNSKQCGRDSARRQVRRKWERVLLALIGRTSLHRFEAESDPEIRDHTLPSTVADIQHKGIRVDREIIELPGYAGGVAHVARYSLDDENRRLALRLLSESA